MLTEGQKKELLQLAPDVLFGEPLSRHTYFRIGGPAEAYVCYTDGYDYGPLKRLLKFCAVEKIKVTVLGGGSNVLVGDEGLSGLTLRLDTKHIQIPDYGMELNPVPVQVSAGDSMQELVKYAMVRGLSGLEPFLGLPGTVGGAVYNNAHFKRSQLFGNFVTKVWAVPISLANVDEEHFYTRADLDFDYDHSVFQDLEHRFGKKELIICVEMELPKGDKVKIKELAERLLSERKNSQPTDLPSSGCIFKNPAEHTTAGELVDTAGLKGFRIGGAEVSRKHANFIVNPEHTATAEDVLRLIAHIKKVVLEKNGIDLELEIFMLRDETKEEEETDG